jgi:hypothetical protein
MSASLRLMCDYSNQPFTQDRLRQEALKRKQMLLEKLSCEVIPEDERLIRSRVNVVFESMSSGKNIPCIIVGGPKNRWRL